MEIILSQNVMVNHNSIKFSEVKRIQKILQGNVIPHKGDFIEDSLYKNPNEYEVTDVIINYEQNYCHVTLSPIILGNEDSVKSFKEEIAPLHGWE